MKKLILLSTIGLFLYSCSGNPSSTIDPAKTAQSEEEKAESAKKMTYNEAMAYTSEERIPVIVEGYVQTSVISNFTATTQSVNVYGHRNQTSGKYLYTSMPIGNGKNQMKQLPKEYHPSDVVIMDKSGKKIGANQRVRLTGTLYAIESYSKKKDYTIYLDVTGMEYVDEVSEDYAAMNLPTLTEKESKVEKNYDKAFKIEGKLEVPMFVLIDNETTVDIITSNNEKINLKVVTGTGESQIAELKENWSPADIKITNSKGAKVNTNKKVTVYGTLSMDGLHVEQIVQ